MSADKNSRRWGCWPTVSSSRSSNCASGEVDVASKIRDGIKRVLQYLRDIARGLTKAEVDPAELVTALDELAARPTETSSIPCSFHAGDAVRITDSLVATHLYHIAQEA